MSEPVEQVVEGSIDTALNVLNNTVEGLEDDIRYFSDFQDALEEFEPSGSSSNQVGVISSYSESDTDRVIELYDKYILSNQDVTDEVRGYSSKFGISLVAADFMDELLGVKNYSREDIKQNIGFLDGSNDMDSFHVRKFRNMAEMPKKARRKSIDETEDEIDQLEDYHFEISGLESRILELNREYELPVDLDDAVYVVDELEDLRSEVERLRSERRQDLDNRSVERGDYFEKNLKLFYEDEDVDMPVLEDLDALEAAVDEAYDSLVVDF